MNTDKFIDASSLGLVFIIAFMRKQLYAYKESSTVKKYINDNNKTRAFEYKEGFVILSPSRILQAKYTGDPYKIERIDEAPYVIWLKQEDLEMFLNNYNKMIRMAVSEQIRENNKQRNKRQFLNVIKIIVAVPSFLMTQVLNVAVEIESGGIIFVILIVCFVTWNSGFKKGTATTYGPTKIAAIQIYEAKIGDLKKQIDDISQNYEKNIAVLRQKQAHEINALGTRQITEIAKLKEEKASELHFTQTKYEDELKETQETYYVKGQTDIRSSIQNQIDSKARVNPLKNDWDAPVFSTKR
jgi:hypothetical protein